ncbi:MAG: alpha-glucan family phosphorylase [Burkholderiaceae bacterium]|nr:alpha-glucan family phosphorylase [Rhodoferax sp.]MCB2039393.1 alpha-glucan family phosphorylase [Rhodoferax sp.]MCP5261466.1 alpha-glucan family phosphorylase [Rhodoferax sp.]
MPATDSIAYFSMEIALADTVPTYSGGLGVLAGDTIRSAADGEVPMVAVTLVHRKGYFRQRLDAQGNQTEEAQPWSPADRLTELPARVTVSIEGRAVVLRAWRFDTHGVGGAVVPTYLLDADLPDNTPADRTLTDHLYGGDQRYRLCQEIILGIGGVRMLRALGYESIRRFHMNEGHAALLVLELGYEEMRRRGQTEVNREIAVAVRTLCVFTTHTPVPAGHDQFALGLLHHVLTDFDHAYDRSAVAFCLDGILNMTYLALDNSHYINGVAKRHGEISRQMFGQYKIDSITNGVHAGFWIAPQIQAVLDRHISSWREDNASLRYALGIPRHELWSAHQSARQELVAWINQHNSTQLFSNTFTIGFARRATAYKRADLLFHDLRRLLALHANAGPIQIVYGGKAHPHDGGGKELIRTIFAQIEQLRGRLSVVYLEDYDIAVARRMVAGVDLWLNTPQPPLEASGTSGMKAAMNGVPQLSVPDGWWLEGCIEGVTGWSIGNGGGKGAPAGTGIDEQDFDAESLYNKLETVILPMFYQDQDRYIDVMRHAIALNGSFFNTERMVDQYVRKAYLR